MDIPEKFADFIGEYLSKNGANREKYGIKTEYYITDDVIVHWIRRSSIHKEWCFKTMHKDRIVKKNTNFTAFVYDLDESPNRNFIFDIGTDPQNPSEIKKSNIRKVEIDNKTYFRRGPFLIDMDGDHIQDMSVDEKSTDLTEEYIDCVPPPEMCIFGPYKIDPEYRKQLYIEFPFYTGEEVVGSYLGHNPYFPSQEEWLKSKTKSESESESDSDFE